MEKVKKTTKCMEKQPRVEKSRQPEKAGIKEKVKVVGKSI